jgi:hypothetical protein
MSGDQVMEVEDAYLKAIFIPFDNAKEVDEVFVEKEDHARYNR